MRVRSFPFALFLACLCLLLEGIERKVHSAAAPAGRAGKVYSAVPYPDDSLVLSAAFKPFMKDVEGLCKDYVIQRRTETLTGVHLKTRIEAGYYQAAYYNASDKCLNESFRNKSFTDRLFARATKEADKDYYNDLEKRNTVASVVPALSLGQRGRLVEYYEMQQFINKDTGECLNGKSGFSFALPGYSKDHMQAAVYIHLSQAHAYLGWVGILRKKEGKWTFVKEVAFPELCFSRD